MKSARALVILVVLVSVSSILWSQEDSTIKTKRLSDHLYLLSTDQGSYTTNSIVSVGEDGLLLVDTQAKDDAEALKKAVEAFGKGAPKFIVNTHRHVEHVGGNAIFGSTPVIIAHALVPSKLRSGSFLFEEFPDETLPDITLADSLTLYFNGEKIRIIAFGGSHDDNEIIIHFTGSKVVHLSSVVNGFNFPSIDAAGDVFGFPVLVERAMKILPEDVTIVSGHNDPGSWKELRAYHEMLVGSIEAVRERLAEGKDLAQMQEENILDPWKSYAGSYVSVDQWTEYIVDSFEKKGKPEKKKIYDPMYYAIRDGGLEAGIERYFDLKKNHLDEYEVTGNELWYIGTKYLSRDKLAEAIRFFELSLDEAPDGKYTYYVHYCLGLAYRDSGNRDKAMKNCKKTLDLNPEFQAAADLLEEIEEM